MAIQFKQQDLEHLLTGTVFFGTGGGLSFTEHKKIFDAAFRKKKSFTIKPANEFKPSDYLASVYGVGDPSKLMSNADDLIKKAVREYEKLTAIKIKGVIPGELGAEGLAFQTAAVLSLPVVDSDLVGGRAAPEIQMDVFSVFGESLTPVMGMAGNSKSILLQGEFTAHEIESTLRTFFSNNGGVGVLVGYPITAKKYAQIGMQHTVSNAIQVGKAFGRKKMVDLIAALPAKTKAYQLTIKKVDLKSSSDGFYRGFIHFSDGSYMLAKNEHIGFYSKQGRALAKVPDILAFVSSSMKPIHNTEMKKYVGKQVHVVHISAQGYWSKTDAKKLWKNAFDGLKR